MLYDRSSIFDFLSISQDLEEPGALLQPKQYRFRFNAVEKHCETYSGSNVRLRYFLRVTVERSYAANTVAEQDIIVQLLYPPQEVSKPIKSEVGIENCLHLEFEYTASQ